MGICVCVISGNVTKDAEMRQTSTGVTITKFTLAYNLRRKVQGDWAYVPNFIDVTVFGRLGEKICERLTKGANVTVQGELEQSTWEKEGQKHSKFGIVADAVDIAKAQRSTQEQASLYDSDCPF